MSLELTGTLIQVLDEQSGSGKNGVWRKKEFVIETGDQYPKKICMNLWGDRIDMLNGLAIGSSLKVSFDVESREYQGRWYTDVKAWRVEGLANQENGNTNQTQSTGTIDRDPFPDDMMGSDDNLPF